jgi:hypothetical protein
MKTTSKNFANLNNSKVVNTVLKNVIGLSIALLFASCMPDTEVEPYQPQPNGIALNNRFENNRLDAVQTFTLDAATGGEIVGLQGTKVNFPPNVFGLNGSPVTGNVSVQLIEIYDKADIILKNMSTLGERNNGDKEALKSAGEFFIDATQGANNLELLGMIEVTSRNVAPADMDWNMQLFRAGNDLNDTDTWVEADEDNNGEADGVEFREAQGANGVMATYNFNLGNFGWSNLDRWYSFTGPKTEIFVDVPAGYDEENCAVFLYYDGESTAIARMDVYNETNEMFTEHYGLIPIGLNVHIIVVTEIDGQVHYAIQGTTIVDNHIEVVSSLSPISQTALESLINGLP